MKTAILNITALFFSCVSIACAQGNLEHYIVEKGDTLSTISRKFHVSSSELTTANPGLNPARLAEGQDINIPATLSHPESGFASEIQSAEFKAAFNYGVAQSLYSVFELNCWSPLCGDEAFQLTKKIHAALGSSIKVDIVGRKNEDNSLVFEVFLPEFKIRNRILSLKFQHDSGAYRFFGDSFQEEPLSFDSIQKNMEIQLPENYTAIVKSEFRLMENDKNRLQKWSQQIIDEAAPDAVGKTNHFFVAPFSPKYDAFQASLYWVEGRKIFKAELNVDPNNHERMTWKELGDFTNVPESQKVADQAAFWEWRNLTISRHVVDGNMIVF